MFRENYRPSERHPEAYGAICVWGMAAETDAAYAVFIGSVDDDGEIARGRGGHVGDVEGQDPARRARDVARRDAPVQELGLAEREGWKLEELRTEEGQLDEVFRRITLPDTVKK